MGESNVVLAPLANQYKVPIVIGNMDQKVALPLTYAFAVFAYWAHQATILPGFIQNVLSGGGKKIGVVYEGTSTAKDAKIAFTAKAKEAGLNVAFEQPIAQNQSTCANEVSNLQARGVELVVMLNGPLGAICMLRDAKALGYRPTWTGVGVSWNFNIVAQASGGGADGIRMLSSNPTLETPAGRHYSELMRKAAPNSGTDSDDVYLMFYALLRSVIEAPPPGRPRPHPGGPGPDVGDEDERLRLRLPPTPDLRPRQPLRPPVRRSQQPAAPTAAGPPSNQAGEPTSDLVSGGVMPSIVDFNTVSTVGLESSPVSGRARWPAGERGPLLQEQVRPRLHGGACERRQDDHRLGAPHPSRRNVTS